MRFYLQPNEGGETLFINFTQVTLIRVLGPSIEVHILGIEKPIVLKKTTATLNMISKGMDVSDNTKEQIIKL